jgi:hypothetical protein
MVPIANCTLDQCKLPVSLALDSRPDIQTLTISVASSLTPMILSLTFLPLTTLCSPEGNDISTPPSTKRALRAARRSHSQSLELLRPLVRTLPD